MPNQTNLLQGSVPKQLVRFSVGITPYAQCCQLERSLFLFGQVAQAEPGKKRLNIATENSKRSGRL